MLISRTERSHSSSHNKPLLDQYTSPCAPDIGKKKMLACYKDSPLYLLSTMNISQVHRHIWVTGSGKWVKWQCILLVFI